LPPSPKEIRCYQLLVKKQLEHFKLSQKSNTVEYLVYVLNTQNMISTEISKSSLGYKYVIHDISKDHELSSCIDVLQGLKSRGVVIELGKIDNVSIYTTLHGDIVFRVIRGRAYEDDLDGRWVGHYIIEFEESKLPNFNAVKVEDLKKLLIDFFTNNGVKEKEANAATEAVVEGLKNAGFKSLALWQYKAIENILLGAEDYYVIDAPTATGKTLVFMIPTIAYALAKKLQQGQYTQSIGVSSDGALLVYPRKSLQKQQLELLLRILHHANNYLKKKLGIELTVAIDKGATEEQDYDEKEIAEIDLGNGLQGKLIQVRTRSKVGGSEVVQLKTFLELANKQRIPLTYFKGMALHRDDRNYILSQSPDILITNPWTIRERVKSTKPDFRNSYIERSFIVFDEAHVHININYLDLVAAIKLYRHMLNSQTGKKVKFVLSSATIPLRNKKELAQWVLGICKDDKCTSYDIDLNMISLIEYDKLEPDNPNKVLKVIITLLPYRLSIETLVQGIIQILAAALMNRSLKTIVFVDSISEVSTLRKYIDTIFHYREGIEICDHILNVSCRYSKGTTISPSLIRSSFVSSFSNAKRDAYDDYSWSHLVLVTDLINKHVDDLLNRIQRAADSIKEHHGALADNVRRSIEQGFAKGAYKILLATSTLDLGVNFDDVTFIVQYKEPISDEALIQRVGRAGRKDESFRIAMAFYIPTYTPIQVQIISSKMGSTSTSLSLSPVLLPHPAIVHKLFNVENTEYDIKQRLFSIVMSRAVSLQQLINAALSNIVSISSSNRYGGVFVPLDRRILKSIDSVVKDIMARKKDVVANARHLPSACKPKGSVIGPTSAENIYAYIMKWIKGMGGIFSKYAELGAGLALLTHDEARKQLNMLKQEVAKWINNRPQTISLNNNIITVVLPAQEEPQRSINLSKIRDPNKCRNSINSIMNAINDLMNSVNSLLQFLERIGDVRPFIIALHETRKPKKVKDIVTQNNFEYVWYNEGLKDYVLKHIRLLLGMVSHHESDSIKLSIK